VPGSTASGDRAEARRLLGEADAAAASLGRAYPSGLIAVLQARALDGFFAVDPGAVRAAAGQAVALARETGDLYALEIMLLNLGSAALLDGELGEAKPLLAEALRIAREIDDRVAQFYLLAALGCHAAEAGQARLAARLIASADAERTGPVPTSCPGRSARARRMSPGWSPRA
jgi:ATP/maltotriose-dependent transcriptional regulator MalT